MMIGRKEVTLIESDQASSMAWIDEVEASIERDLESQCTLKQNTQQIVSHSCHVVSCHDPGGLLLVSGAIPRPLLLL